ncbi:Major Facilitator Superfamily [Pelomyxa schiedti]|nr:Major Facilitator Superfamily [Pelomyxa schiedti]
MREQEPEQARVETPVVQLDVIPATQSNADEHPKVNVVAKWTLLLSKMVILAFTSVGLWSYYDSPGLLYPFLETHYNLTALQLGKSYSLYCFPNLFMPVAVGVLVDKGPFGFDLRFAIILTTFLIGLASVIQAASSGVVEVFLFARFVLGLGGESLLSSQFRAAAMIFRSNELGMATGVLFVVGQIAACCLFNISPTIAENTSLTVVFIVTAIVAVLAFGDGIVVALLFKSKLKRPSAETVTSSRQSNSNTFSIKSILLSTAKGSLRYLRKFPLRYWLLLFSISVPLGIVVSLMVFSTDLAVDKWEVEPVLAARYSSVMVIVPLVLGVPVGYLLDRFGHRLTAILTGCFLQLGALCILAFSETHSSVAYVLVAFALIGITYTLWPITLGACIPLCLPESVGAVGMGVCYQLPQ